MRQNVLGCAEISGFLHSRKPTPSMSGWFHLICIFFRFHYLLTTNISHSFILFYFISFDDDQTRCWKTPPHRTNNAFAMCNCNSSFSKATNLYDLFVQNEFYRTLNVTSPSPSWSQKSLSQMWGIHDNCVCMQLLTCVHQEAECHDLQSKLHLAKKKSWSASSMTSARLEWYTYNTNHTACASLCDLPEGIHKSNTINETWSCMTSANRACQLTFFSWAPQARLTKLWNLRWNRKYQISHFLTCLKLSKVLCLKLTNIDSRTTATTRSNVCLDISRIFRQFFSFAKNPATLFSLSRRVGVAMLT